MESHHDDDETKGSVYLFVQDYIEARKASGSVRSAGPKDLTVTVHWPNSKPWSESQSQGPEPAGEASVAVRHDDVGQSNVPEDGRDEIGR